VGQQLQRDVEPGFPMVREIFEPERVPVRLGHVAVGLHSAEDEPWTPELLRPGGYVQV
jgi:hypothetical protein